MKKLALYFCCITSALYLINCKQKSLNFSISKTTDSIRTSPFYKKALSYKYIKNDSSFYYFNEIASNSKDSLEIAMAYNEMAILQNDAGDYFGSEESLLASLKSLNEKNPLHYPCLFSDYNELSFVNLNLKNYNIAIEYSNKALQFVSDRSYEIFPLNNQALAYQKKKEYTTAISIYKKIIEWSKPNKQEYARILSNMAKTKWLENPNYPARDELLEALKIRQEERDSWGLNASYGHLADYYAQLLPDSARYYANALKHIAEYLKSPDDELAALSKLIPLSTFEKYKEYFKQHQFLSDSLQTARSNAKNQFALIRYNAEKHKAENLTLQKENAETRLRILWWQVILMIVAILTIIGFIWYRKRKQQAIQEQQLQMSKKVHDKVANKVYRIMSEVEHKGLPEKNVLLYKLNTVYNQSRDISYDQPGKDNHNFQQSVSELLESFASDTVKVASVGHSQQIWEKMTPVAREELSIIIEELMTNMKKHSSASNVVLKFIQKENEVEVQYIDDGIGLPPGTLYGNGLRNTETRIKDIGGRIIFDKTIPGLKVRIFIPIAK